MGQAYLPNTEACIKVHMQSQRSKAKFYYPAPHNF